MVRSVSGMPFKTMQNVKAVTSRNVTGTYFKGEEKLAKNVNAKAKDPTKIGYFRAVFSRLTDEQINNVNESGKLNGNVKFRSNGQGGYVIVPNIMNVSVGTKTLPAGFELKKNFLGFTCVVPKDSESILLKKSK